ncbi:MAG: nuclear transport factor 2 family protein [Gammaproteobacteria bacterium]|nr:nuclear transport factor 2 family protein [Gammaproteobacteria bacterium]
MAAGKNLNEEVVRTFFRKLSASDLEGVRAVLNKGAYWEVMVTGIPGTGIHRGRDTIVDKFLAPIRGMFRPGDPKIKIVNIFSRGPMVAIETRVRGRFRDGKEYRNKYSWIIEVRRNRIDAIRE